MLLSSIDSASATLKQGGVIAYPTESCFGLGCDPYDEQAVQRILAIKQRSVDQGLIVVAADLQQVQKIADWSLVSSQASILASWPGPTTWLLPRLDTTPKWVCGEHSSIAVRISDHSVVQALCSQFGGAIVSTSANRHGNSSLLSAAQVESEMGGEIDCILDLPLGGLSQPSKIIDALSGRQLR